MVVLSEVGLRHDAGLARCAGQLLAAASILLVCIQTDSLDSCVRHSALLAVFVVWCDYVTPYTVKGYAHRTLGKNGEEFA